MHGRLVINGETKPFFVRWGGGYFCPYLPIYLFLFKHFPTKKLLNYLMMLWWEINTIYVLSFKNVE